MSNKVTILFTTISTLEDAEQLARITLSNNMAACVNIIPNGTSIYIWNGGIEKQDECYMLFKTTPDKIQELEQFIIAKHPYDIPAILKITTSSSKEFCNYITKSIEYHE